MKHVFKHLSRRALILSALAVGLLLLVGPFRLLHHYYLTPCAAEGPERQSEFPMHLEPIDLHAYNTRIESFANTFDISILEKITFQDEQFPVFQIDWRPENSTSRLLIIAATHGDEFASALVVPELLERIEQDSRYESWQIRVVTPANPVGLAHQSRYNEDGCDINRDFRTFETRGAQLQRDAIDRFQPDLILSLHEGPQEGFFLIATKSVPLSLRKELHQQLIEANTDLAEKSFLGLPLKQSGIFYEGWWISEAKKLLGIHTLGRHGETLGIPVITTESSWIETDLEKRIQPHLTTIEAVVTYEQ